MRADAAELVRWPAAGSAASTPPVALPAVPEPEPEDLTACLAGPNGNELVVELAHDIRSPLTSILFMAEALQNEQGGPVTESQRQQLRLVYSAALCLCATASDVLELARGGRRLVDRAPSPFSVAEIFASVRSMIMPLAEQKGLEVRLLHPVPERRVGHARALSRVLLNLATNAVKFTDRGLVEVAGQPLDRARVEFSVRDTGEGIDPDTLRTLYQPFRKAPSGPRHYFSSAGLGLAICRKLVRAMGSALQVETRPGWGTRFWFVLEVPPATTSA